MKLRRDCKDAHNNCNLCVPLLLVVAKWLYRTFTDDQGVSHTVTDLASDLLMESGICSDHKGGVLKKTYKNCFSGRDAVRFWTT